MLRASSVNEEIAGIMQMILKSDLDGAKKRVGALAPNVRTERMRGSLAAVNGIITSKMKKKEGGLRPWDEEKALRAAHQMMKSQLLDDFDKGYAETVTKYAKAKVGSNPRVKNSLQKYPHEQE